MWSIVCVGCSVVRVSSGEGVWVCSAVVGVD